MRRSSLSFALAFLCFTVAGGVALAQEVLSADGAIELLAAGTPVDAVAAEAGCDVDTLEHWLVGRTADSMFAVIRGGFHTPEVGNLATLKTPLAAEANGLKTTALMPFSFFAPSLIGSSIFAPSQPQISDLPSFTNPFGSVSPFYAFGLTPLSFNDGGRFEPGASLASSRLCLPYDNGFSSTRRGPSYRSGTAYGGGATSTRAPTQTRSQPRAVGYGSASFRAAAHENRAFRSRGVKRDN